MARFMGKVKASDGTSFDVPAETCPECKGIGYLTGVVTYQSRLRGEKDVHIHRAESGDRCPLCVGHGWVGVLGTGTI